MEANKGYVFVSIPNEFNEHAGGTKLITDWTHDKWRYKTIHGKVLSACRHPGSGVLYPVPLGYPKSREMARNQEIVRTTHQKVIIQKGDTIYFHYLTVSPGNYIKREKGAAIYKVPYESIFCTIRNKKIFMINGNVLVTDVYEKGYGPVDVEGKDIMASTKEITRTDGSKVELVTGIADKPQYRKGMIQNIGDGIPPLTRATLNEGDTIIFREDSEFDNEIQNKEYYVMKQWDIMAKVSGKEVTPVGEYVYIEPDPWEQGESKVFLPDKARPLPITGVVLDIGDLVEDMIENGDRVQFKPEEKSFFQLEADLDSNVLIADYDIYVKFV